MDTLRTADERFEGLSGYPFAPHYADVGDTEGGTLRVHYLDEGPSGGEAVVLMHGEPSWSYLYRHMIPVLAASGHRTIAPDLVGFGRSDKPAARADYTYARHVEWMRAVLFDVLDLSAVTLVCQDWGGLIGLRLVGEHPERFARVVAANTFLPTGDRPLGDSFALWQRFSQEADPFAVGDIVNGGCTTALSQEVVAAYDAPFPEESYLQGARQFPMLVPNAPDDPASEANRAAWRVLETFDRPFLTAFGDSDPITRGAEKALQSRIPGAAGQEHRLVAGGGHFIQEDRGPELAGIVVDFTAATAADG